MPKITIQIFGPIPSKKNRYRAIVQKAGKHKGKARLVKDRKLNSKLNYIVEQIPVEFWDLGLSHPALHLWRFCPETGFRQDRDGIFTALLDILVRLGILMDDSDITNNGEWTIHPTQIADQERLVLTLESDEIDEALDEGTAGLE